MADYINREKLLEHIKDAPTWEIDDKGVHDTKYPKGMFDCEDVVASIENAPADDVELVRHGKWIAHSTMIKALYAPNYDCSVCGKSGQKTAYCPHCGAKMEE